MIEIVEILEAITKYCDFETIISLTFVSKLFNIIASKSLDEKHKITTRNILTMIFKGQTSYVIRFLKDELITSDVVHAIYEMCNEELFLYVLKMFPEKVRRCIHWQNFYFRNNKRIMQEIFKIVDYDVPYENFDLYEWTKKTIDDPAKKSKYTKSFALYVGGDEVYEKDKADALEAELKPLVGGPIVAKMFKYDTDPAHNPQPPRQT